MEHRGDRYRCISGAPSLDLLILAPEAEETCAAAVPTPPRLLPSHRAPCIMRTSQNTEASVNGQKKGWADRAAMCAKKATLRSKPWSVDSYPP